MPLQVIKSQSVVLAFLCKEKQLQDPVPACARLHLDAHNPLQPLLVAAGGVSAEPANFYTALLCYRA